MNTKSNSNLLHYNQRHHKRTVNSTLKLTIQIPLNNTYDKRTPKKIQALHFDLTLS